MATETQSAATEQVHHTEPASMQSFLADSRKQAAAELRRQSEIMRVCNEHKQPGIAAEAIEQGWSVEKAEVAAMKASLPKPGAAANPHTTTFGNGGQGRVFGCGGARRQHGGGSGCKQACQKAAAWRAVVTRTVGGGVKHRSLLGV